MEQVVNPYGTLEGRRVAGQRDTWDSEKVLPSVNWLAQRLINGSNQSSGIGIKINLNFFYKGE